MNLNLHFKIAGSDVEQVLRYDLKAAKPVTVAPNVLTIQAAYSGSDKYTISLTIDGVVYQGGDFTSITAVWEYIQKYWLNLGKWYLLTDKIVFYVNAASAVFTIVSPLRLTVLIPPPEISDVTLPWYLVVFNGQASPVGLLHNADDVLAYAIDQWGAFGVWELSGDYLVFTPSAASVNTLTVTKNG